MTLETETENEEICSLCQSDSFVFSTTVLFSPRPSSTLIHFRYVTMWIFQRIPCDSKVQYCTLFDSYVVFLYEAVWRFISPAPN